MQDLTYWMPEGIET